MKSLTGLDATFLYLETPEMPMHVGSFNLCELPAGFKGSFHQEVTKHIAKRLHLAPVFSRKLVFMPLDLGHPLWVEADAVDISFHIRRADNAKKGTAPMTLAEAHKLCAELHGELIDRNFPLWEFYVFDRIQLPDLPGNAKSKAKGKTQGGKVVAGFFSKIHHAALDGKGGVMLANAMLDLSPVPREVAPPDPARRRKLASDLKLGKMIGSVFSSSLGQIVKAAKALPLAASALGNTLGSTLARQSISPATGVKVKMPMRLAPATPFNAGITSGRVFVTATAPLDECKAISRAVGGSFNDLVLWICSTALRNYLMQHHSLPKKSLVAAMPVSLRANDTTGDATELGNQVSLSLVELGTHLANPLKRMNAIMASTGKVKTSMQSLKGLLPTDYPSLLAPWLVGGAAKMAFSAYGTSGIASRLPTVANLVISNVPGPPVPLYLAGAQFLSFHPLSIIVHGLALNITIQTYAGKVDFGIVADKQALPHAKDLAKAIETAFAQAQTLMTTEPSTSRPSAGVVASAPAPASTPVFMPVIVTKMSVKTRKTAVTQETKSAESDITPPTKSRKRADTVSTRHNPAPNASSHGKSAVKTVKTVKIIKAVPRKDSAKV